MSDTIYLQLRPKDSEMNDRETIDITQHQPLHMAQIHYMAPNMGSHTHLHAIPPISTRGTSALPTMKVSPRAASASPQPNNNNSNSGFFGVSSNASVVGSMDFDSEYSSYLNPNNLRPDRYKYSDGINDERDISDNVYLQEVACLGATACWNLQKWDKMRSFMKCVSTDNTEGCFLHAVESVKCNQIEPGNPELALEWIETCRRRLDNEMVSMFGESYERLYPYCVRAQQLMELEEVNIVACVFFFFSVGFFGVCAVYCVCVCVCLCVWSIGFGK